MRKYLLLNALIISFVLITTPTILGGSKMNEEEKGIEIPCVSCGKLLHLSPGEYGITTNYEEYVEENSKDYLQADLIIGSSANRFVLNIPGIVCNGDCSLDLLDTVPDPPGLVCVVEITPTKAASAMMQMQFIEGTEAVVDFFLQLFPTSAEVMDIAAIRLYQEGEKRRAYDILEKGIEHCDDADKLRIELAVLCGMDGASLLGLQLMQDVSPDTFRYHVIKGNLHRAADQWGEAADCWKMAIETDPSDEVAWFNLGYFLLSVEERFSDAEQHFLAACDAFPAERRFRAFLGDSLFFQKRKTDALKEYHRALPMQGGDSQFEDTLRSMINQCEGGMSLAKDPDVEKKEAACKQAIKSNPDDAEAHYKLGIAYYESGKHKETVKAFKQAIRIDPDYIDAHYNLGVIYDNLGMYEEAIEAYKQAIKIDPDYALAYYGLGLAYANLNDTDSALEQYKILKSLDSELANELFHDGQL